MTLPSSIPTKIRWFLPPASTHDPVEQFRSKSLKKFGRKLDELLQEQNLHIHTSDISLDDFMSWTKPYTEYMIQKKYEVLANEAWYHKKIEAGDTVHAISISQGDRVVASEIYVIKQGGKAVSSAFRYSDPSINFSMKQGSLGAAMDIVYLKHVAAQGFSRISKGRSRNAFGLVNSFGNLVYKLRLGLDIQPDPDTPFSETIPRSENNSTLFFHFEGSTKFAFVREIKTDPINPELRNYYNLFHVVEYS